MERGVTPVLGVVLLIGITVVAAAIFGFAASAEPADPVPMATFSGTVDSDSGRISITHSGGDIVDLNAVELRIEIDGEPLREQPPVPFFAASGFVSGPTGPLNSASSDQWRAGQTGTLTIAATNEPQIVSGATVTVVVRTERGVIAKLHETA